MITHRQARQEELGRLRSDAAADRLGRHARHHHRADAEAAGHPAGDRRRRLPVSERRGGLLGGHRDHPDGHSGGPHRTGQRAADAGDDELFEARLSRDARACSSSSTAARPASPSRPQTFGEIAAEYGGGPFLWTSDRRGADEAVEGPARRLLGVADAAARRQGAVDRCLRADLAACRMHRRDRGRHRRAWG